MEFDDDYEDLTFYFTEQLLDQIDAWRKAQRPAIEIRRRRSAIDRPQPTAVALEGIDVRVRIVGSTVKKLWEWARSP